MKLLLIALFLISGCQNFNTQLENQVITGHDASKSLDENLITIGYENAAIKKDSNNPTVIAHTESQKVAIDSAKSKMPAINTGLVAGAKAIEENKKDKQTITKLNNQFLSPLQLSYLKVAKITILTISVLWFILSILENFTGPIGKISSFLLGIIETGMTIGFNLITPVLQSITRWIANLFKVK